MICCRVERRSPEAEVQPEEAQAEQEAADPVHDAAAPGPGEEVPRQTVPEHSREGGILQLLEADGNTGNPLGGRLCILSFVIGDGRAGRIFITGDVITPHFAKGYHGMTYRYDEIHYGRHQLIINACERNYPYRASPAHKSIKYERGAGLHTLLLGSHSRRFTGTFALQFLIYVLVCCCKKHGITLYKVNNNA